jgi:hypothetical protein
MAETTKNSSHLIINVRDGFFHTMLSYRVKPDADLVTKIHDKLHLLAPNAGKSVSQVNQLLDSSPFPEGFKRDQSTLNSSLRVFLDAFCLKDGVGWEGDGDAKNGGFVGAVRLSPVFVPLFSATEIVTANSELAQQGSGKGSVGQMIGLAHKDMQDNVLLELIIARELHLMSKTSRKTNGIKALFPCSYIFPLFRNEDVWKAASSLPKTASALTNAKAKQAMEQMGISYEAISPELRDGTLTVDAVWQFFTQFQGIKLYDRGEERFQVAAAANAIIGVIDEVRSNVAESKFHDLVMGSSQMYELAGFMSQLNMSNYTPILASHHVSNVFQLAELKHSRADAIVQSIAEYGVRASDKSTLPIELSKVWSAIQAAQSSPLAKPLNDRFRNFIDREASFVTIFASSSLFDIILSKKVALVLIFLFGAALFFQYALIWVHRSHQLITHKLVGVPIILFMLSCFLAAFHTPRLGRYCLVLAFFIWAGLDTASMIIMMDSAINKNCHLCNPADFPSDASNIQIVFFQLNNFIFLWIIAFCLAMKQQYTMLFGSVGVMIYYFVYFPVMGYPFILRKWGFSDVFNSAIFWFGTIFIMKSFQYIGNRRAQSIYQQNSKNVEDAYQELRETEIKNKSWFGQLVIRPASESQPSQSTCYRIFARKQQNSKQMSGTDMVVYVPERDQCSSSNSGENQRENTQLLAQTTPTAQSASEAMTLGKSPKIVNIPGMFSTERTLQGDVLQEQSSFEKLIKDAEFINDAFQDWVSSWLSGGPDFDAVQKYFFSPTEAFGPDQFDRSFCNLSRKLERGGITTKSASENLSENRSEEGVSYEPQPIEGKLIRGPLKHVDRAIAKASTLFATSTSLSELPFLNFVPGNSRCLSHCITTGAPCVFRRFQEVDGHREVLCCCCHT